nr:hypothetical protein [Anaerolineae bacterium]
VLLTRNLILAYGNVGELERLYSGLLPEIYQVILATAFFIPLAGGALLLVASFLIDLWGVMRRYNRLLIAVIRRRNQRPNTENESILIDPSLLKR